MVINVDESSFDRSIKNQYSWLPIGESATIINDRVIGKASLILGVWSSSEWLAVVMVGTVDSAKFCIFLKLLELVIKSTYCELGEFPIVVMDNARTHSSKITQSIMKDLIYQVKFSAPY